MPQSASFEPAFDHPRPLRVEARPPGLAAAVAPWFGFLGGAVAWALHLVVVYSLAEISCQSGRLDTTYWGVPAAAFFGYAITVWAALTALGAALVAFTRFRVEPRTDPVDDTGALEVLGRRRFMAYVGVTMNGVFLIAILAGGLPFLFLRTCTGS
jgi:hypothetical protein